MAEAVYPGRVVRVALDVPRPLFFDYLAVDSEAITPQDVGRRVLVPFGQYQKVGIVVELPASSDLPLGQLKPLLAVFRDLPPLPADWFRLVRFCAGYYHVAQGRVMLSVLPAGLRSPQVARRSPRSGRADGGPAGPGPRVELTDEQAAALLAVTESGAGFRAHLLHGVTGSGKTEVYLQLIESVLAMGRQTLLLVPEINLTPQLEARVAARFPDAGLVCLHSDLGEAERTRNWSAALTGRARVVLGTRLAVFTPLPELGLIIVDEEHDPSFRQQDGLRYSARDLAVFRASDGNLPIVLGSATPSLESWANATTSEGRGRYRLLSLRQRAVPGASLPRVRIVDTRLDRPHDGVSSTLHDSIGQCLARGEQSLVFLNRRGYAPVLLCAACGWTSRCHRCAANLVLHLVDRRLRCHHCGFATAAPKSCPDCGNQDISAFGRGTQRIEVTLHEAFPEARIVRVDRDSATTRRQWEGLLQTIRHGGADILVGTQMLAKGHDFPRLTLVGAIAPDAALFAADWRGPERLFAQLMQVAGRAGRAERPGEVVLQTRFPDHPLYAALARHDYPGFAAAELVERRRAGFPPYVHQAMLRAEAAGMSDALAFLATARESAQDVNPAGVTLYDPVPMRLSRRANRERAQLLVDSPSRPALQRFLESWLRTLEALKVPATLRWHVEVDPLEV